MSKSQSSLELLHWVIKLILANMIQQQRLCYMFVLLVATPSLIFAVPLCQHNNSYKSDTLELVHIVFRHGDRTPDRHGLWPSNAYYNESFYEPYGYAQLTNEGKNREYNLGSELRKRYGDFLGDKWNMKLYDAWSTNYNRTKMSMALVLAGLFPPRDPLVWQKNLLWQPIPYNSLPISQDKELSSWACPTVVPLIYNDEHNMKRLHHYDGLMEDLRRGTGEDVDYISALDLYFGMLIQYKLGFPLQTWTKAVYPEPLKTYIVDFYYIETSTKELKTVIAGYFLKKMLTDTVNKKNGTLNPQERKIFLYSGHEVNVATIITSLESFNLVDPPPYGSYIAFEVHKINGIYGIQMFYQDYETDEPHLMSLRGCGTFCPIDNFIALTASIIPKSDVECYGEQ